MVAINIIGDPADLGDESNIVSLASFIPKEENLFQQEGNTYFCHKKCHLKNLYEIDW